VTAEVAILNKSAVALAADSAVTTGFPGQEKIFTGANKIFTLSKYAPVGVMIYGHVEHFSFPWEVILKQFRRRLGRRRFPHVADYLNELVTYIRSPPFLDSKQQEGFVLYCCMSAYLTLGSVLREKNLKWRAADIKHAMDRMEEIATGYEVLADFKAASYNGFVRQYNSLLEDFLKDKEYFTPNLPRACWHQFTHCVFLSVRISMPTAHSTGLVVAGFGEDDWFPALAETRVDGGCLDTIRLMPGITKSIERGGDTVFVRAFAQDDVVNAFMKGVDDGVLDRTQELLFGFMQENIEHVLRGHTGNTEDEIKVILRMAEKGISDAINDFRKELLSFSRETYVQPVEEVLRVAPKDELAEVAESFVSLTSLKRRVSGERETVSGPVDVAVISKGDGFVWIKRKHYFDANLNQHFGKIYFDDMEGGEHGQAE